ncbi:MAG: hypothetical protein H6617_04555 [Bdellovibrionaceae bacterium]|nr:hypothetical protein [Pseudobdellovibrionaceae bacterium]
MKAIAEGRPNLRGFNHKAEKTREETDEASAASYVRVKKWSPEELARLPEDVRDWLESWLLSNQVRRSTQESLDNFIAQARKAIEEGRPRLRSLDKKRERTADEVDEAAAYVFARRTDWTEEKLSELPEDVRKWWENRKPGQRNAEEGLKNFIVHVRKAIAEGRSNLRNHSNKKEKTEEEADEVAANVFRRYTKWTPDKLAELPEDVREWMENRGANRSNQASLENFISEVRRVIKEGRPRLRSHRRKERTQEEVNESVAQNYYARQKWTSEELAKLPEDVRAWVEERKKD